MCRKLFSLLLRVPPSFDYVSKTENDSWEYPQTSESGTTALSSEVPIHINIDRVSNSPPPAGDFETQVFKCLARSRGKPQRSLSLYSL